MSCSARAPESGAPAPAEAPLAAGGGIGWTPPVAADPCADFDDLMVLVEALCPEWPPREPFGPMTRMRL